MDNLEKLKKGRPKIYENGFHEHYAETKYNLNYYYEHKHEKIQCPICGQENVTKVTLRAHQRTKKCLNFVNKNI